MRKVAPPRFHGSMSRIRLWLRTRVWRDGQFVGREVVPSIKVKGDSCRFWPERLGIHMANIGDYGVGIIRDFDPIALRTQIKRDLRFARASGELSVQHIVDLAQPRIGGMAAGSASSEPTGG